MIKNKITMKHFKYFESFENFLNEKTLYYNPSGYVIEVEEDKEWLIYTIRSDNKEFPYIITKIKEFKLYANKLKPHSIWKSKAGSIDIKDSNFFTTSFEHFRNPKRQKLTSFKGSHGGISFLTRNINYIPQDIKTAMVKHFHNHNKLA